MASPEVCSALPTITWSISSAVNPLRAIASFAAITPRSMALMSLKCPLYSAIGVRAPSTITISFTGRLLLYACVTNAFGADHIRRGTNHQRDGHELGERHQHAPLDPELPAGQQIGPAARFDEQGAHRLVAADLMAEDG